MTTKSRKLPTSKAKNAYDLLTEVERLILAEPKRYNQQRFIARSHGLGDADVLETDYLYPKRPSCGTVGCVAGWVATLKRGTKFSYSQTGDIAARVLGISSEQYGELFRGTALHKSNTAPQTLAHARAGVKHIRAFKRKYKLQLKAKAV